MHAKINIARLAYKLRLTVCNTACIESIAQLQFVQVLEPEESEESSATC